MSQKSFLDNKKITEDFPYVGGRGGGQPTYGKFHMFYGFLDAIASQEVGM